MATTAQTLTESVREVVLAVPSSVAVQTMSDDALLAASSAIAAARRELDAHGGWVAAEISRRSRRELGYGGLAQRQGFRTPEALIERLTGATRAEVVSLVQVGTMVADAAAVDHVDESGSSAPAADPEHWRAEHWRAGIARAVADGELSFAQAEAIRSGLGEATDVITGEVLADAATVLVDAAANEEAPLTVTQLHRLARQLRDSVDAEGLSEREREQHGAQYLKAWKRADGMVGGSLLLDRENGAYFLSILDELTSPRRGGPRFVDPADASRAQKILDDPRSTECIAADGVIELLRIGTAADPNTVYGSRKPAVRIVVTRDGDDGLGRGGHGDRRRGGSEQSGRAQIATFQDTGETASNASVERHICEGGSTTVTVDARGRPLDVGRDQRLFTARQKVALAIRDGGCMLSGCDRHPSWTEAHHIDHYVEHHGRTDTADGILLCRHHHLMLHNNGWRITRDDDRYFLRRSRAEDPQQILIPLHSKNPHTQLASAREHSRQRRAG